MTWLRFANHTTGRTPKFRFLAPIALMGLACPGTAAEFVTFTVDPSRSAITFSGNINGILPIVEQAPGSLVATGSGFIDTILDPTASSATSIEILNSGLQGVLKPGPFQPGNQPAVIAGQVDIGGVTGFGSFTDVSISLAQGPALIDASNQFSVLGLPITVDGLFHALVPGLIDTTYSFGGTAFNDSTAPASLARVGLERILTIPIDISLTDSASGLVLNSHLVGEVVAVSVVPELGTWTLMASATAVVIGGIARRRRG